MLAQLDQIEHNARQALAQAGDEAALEQWRIAHLGRSAPLMGVFDQLGKLSKEERPAIGGAPTRSSAPWKAPWQSRQKPCARRRCAARWKPNAWT